MSQITPKYDFDPDERGRASRIAELTRLKKVYTRGLESMRKRIRNFNTYPSVKKVAEVLDGVLDELDELKSFRKEKLSTPTEMILEQYNREIDADREQDEKLLAEMQKSIPEHQRILGRLHDRDERSEQIVAHGRPDDGVRNLASTGR